MYCARDGMGVWCVNRGTEVFYCVQVKGADKREDRCSYWMYSFRNIVETVYNLTANESQ